MWKTILNCDTSQLSSRARNFQAFVLPQRTQLGRTLEYFGGQSGRRQPALWKTILNPDTSLSFRAINFQGFVLPQRTQIGRILDAFGGQSGRTCPALWKTILNRNTVKPAVS